MFKALGSFSFGKLTQAFGTVITALLPPRRRCFTRLTRLLYRCGGTAHTISVMKSLGKTTLASDVAASGTSAVLSADPGTGTVSGGIATNDWVCIQLDNGTYFLTKVTGVSTLTLTVSALPTAAAAGNTVWFFGAPGDQTSSQTTTLSTPAVGQLFPATASVLNDWADVAAGICQSNQQNEPIMVHSDNATAAGTFELVSGAHTLN